MRAERLQRTAVMGCIVSTASRPDKGCYETAIIDKNDTHIVEEYATRRQAKSNHKKWEDAVLSGVELKDIDGQVFLLESVPLEATIRDIVNTRMWSRVLW